MLINYVKNRLTLLWVYEFCADNMTAQFSHTSATCLELKYKQWSRIHMDNKVESDKLPLVSVIMTAFNHARFVEKAVSSVWAQSYQNIELICLDDGLADNTPAIPTTLSASSPIPMRVIVKKNEGVSRTLNKGIQEAKGSLIGLLASDDYYDSTFIQKNVL